MALEMILKLNAAGMTALHKAGLAGLYMTLDAFEQNDVTIEGLTWKLGQTQIKLVWTEKTPKNAFQKLMKKAFWIDDDGFIRLSGLEPGSEMQKSQRHQLHQAILNGFLQHGRTRKTGKSKSLTYEIEDKTFWLSDFSPLIEIPQHNFVDDFFDSKGDFRTKIKITGWIYPGGGELSEDLEFAFALMFAPIGAVHYLIRSKTKGRKARLALLLPEIKNLEKYATDRRIIANTGVLEMTASSSSDAVLRMLLTIETNQTKSEFESLIAENFLCRVATFGVVDWVSQQKTRTDTRDVVAGKLKGFENYRIANRIFHNRLKSFKTKIKDESGKNVEKDSVFITAYSAREFIADNIARGKNWYDDFAAFIVAKEVREQLNYETKELHQMVTEAIYDDERERLFIYVCHESWRRRMGKLGHRAAQENANFASLVNKDREKLRTSLARCKNAESLRETIIDFWSRGGSNELLQGDGLHKILPLFNEKNWRKAKDLALLALVSYAPKDDKEAEALQAADELAISENTEGNN